MGDVGPLARREFTAIGDTVNLASRVEGLTKELGSPVLATAATRDACGGSFDWQEKGEIAVRGKSLPVLVYAISGGEAATAA